MVSLFEFKKEIARILKIYLAFWRTASALFTVLAC